MHLRGAPQCLRRSFGESQVANLTLSHQFRHRADSLLNRSIWVYPMLVVEINSLNPQAPQAGFAGFAHVIRLAVEPAYRRILWVADNAKLRCEHNLIPLAPDGFADKFFVLVRAVDIGCVEEIDAEFESTVNRGDRFLIVAWPVK